MQVSMNWNVKIIAFKRRYSLLVSRNLERKYKINWRGGRGGGMVIKGGRGYKNALSWRIWGVLKKTFGDFLGQNGKTGSFIVEK